MTRMITIVCFLWTNRDPGERPGFVDYTPHHVNVLRSMLARHLHLPHQLVCVTTRRKGFDPGIRLVSPGRALPAHGEPGVARFPKLALWRADAASWLGGTRLLYLDLDTVITDDITPLVDRPDPIVLTEHTKRRDGTYATPMVLLDAGVAPWIYEQHIAHPDPLSVTRGDQSWVGRHLPAGLPVWREEDGVVLFTKGRDREGPPPGARVVLFSGTRDPSTRWEPWIKEAWR